MSDPDSFLSRWSRRKRGVAEAEKDAKVQAPEAAPEQPAGVDTSSPEPRRPDAAVTPFDLSTLPSIDSITADTDIRGFFAPGVPEDLTRAALRRAWAVDPKIRDFVGLEENAWDFNNPDSVSGFGSLEMTEELRREVARIVGNFMPDEERAPGAASPAMQPLAAHQELAPVRREASPGGQAVEERPTTSSGSGTGKRQYSDELAGAPTSNTAVQQTAAAGENLQSPAKRTHGSALPK